MKRVMMSVMAQVDHRLEARGLTSAQWGPLMRLRAGPSTVVELAGCLHVDAGAMTWFSTASRKKRLCKRVQSTTDRRVVHVELTPAGEAAVAGVPAVLAEVMNAHLAGFSRTEWLALPGHLERMLAAGEALRSQP